MRPFTSYDDIKFHLLVCLYVVVLRYQYCTTNYQTQQLQLFPLIAAAYALTLAGQALVHQYITTQAEIEQGNFEHMQAVSFIDKSGTVIFFVQKTNLASNPTYTKG